MHEKVSHITLHCQKVTNFCYVTHIQHTHTVE